MKILTDTQLRAHWFKTRCGEYTVEEDTFVTPAARDFLKEHGIALRRASPGEGYGVMPQTAIPPAGSAARYLDADTGAAMEEKPEHMTHLRGNLLVPKGHPRILFRGKLDTLEARIMETQIAACDEGFPQIAEALEELYGCIRAILGAEVKEAPLPDQALLGLDSAGLRRVSHHVKEEIGIPHPVPSYRMGRLCVALNSLRTCVRETELAAVAAFCQGADCSRPDIIQALNRLSSAVYILFCRKLAGYYGEGSK